MKKFLLMFGAFMAFNAMINAQTPRPERSGGPAAAPQGTEAKSDDATGKSTTTKPGATSTAPKVTTPSASKPAAGTGGDGTAATDGNIRDHKCTAACKGGNHVLAHGEKGHKCTAACKRRPTTQKAAPVKGANPTK
ncbi:MAG: hypothetical protein IPG21_15560 [Saprospiraceae bacterium]|nr:hypothetical protein [Candidatus Vicinibacter affinis]